MGNLKTNFRSSFDYWPNDRFTSKIRVNLGKTTLGYVITRKIAVCIINDSNSMCANYVDF
jgi:hypothetical protein